MAPLQVVNLYGGVELSPQLLFETFFIPTNTYALIIEMSSGERKGVRVKCQLFLYEFGYNMIVLTNVIDYPQYKM